MNRPNILHLFTDQQRFDTIRALGNPHIHTPNLDRLACAGTVFRRAYTPSPECVPARAAMITGWYPSRTGCTCNARDMPPEETPTLMSRLAEAGYLTHGIGKCHFTPRHDALRGFSRRLTQEEIIGDREADDYSAWLVRNGWGGVLEPHGVRGDMYYIPQVSVLPEAFHPTAWVGDRAVEFLSSRGGEKDGPWYCYTSFVHPHPPFAPPAPWHKDYRAPAMPLPDPPPGREDLLTFVNRFQNRYKFRDRGFDLNLVRCLRAYYYACISFVDFQIGRILDALESTGQAENTLIVFASDHGEYLGDFGCFGKRGMHEVSARIPLLVRWPGGERPAAECSRPASLVDLAPTFLDAAGVDCGEGAFDGVSLRGLARGSVERDVVFSQYNHAENGLYMAVGERWKYVYSAPDRREMLFDLAKDSREQTDLAGEPECAGALDSLRARCLAHLHARGEFAAIDGGKWREYPVRTMPDDPDEGLLFQDPPWWEALGSPTPLSTAKSEPPSGSR